MKRTSFIDRKHKHMMKSGAPPDKFRVLYRMFTYRIPWFHKQNYHSLVPGLMSNFLEMVRVPLNKPCLALPTLRCREKRYQESAVGRGCLALLYPFLPDLKLNFEIKFHYI